MHGPMPQHRFTTGRHLWLCVMVALGLALGTQAATAKECRRETPLPADVRLIAPDSEVPEAMARFAGAWLGAWLDEGSEALCHTLVVEQDIGRWHITPDGHFCSRWHAWDNRRERCVAVYREGENFELYRKDGWVKAVYRRAPGNPEGY